MERHTSFELVRVDKNRSKDSQLTDDFEELISSRYSLNKSRSSDQDSDNESYKDTAVWVKFVEARNDSCSYDSSEKQCKEERQREMDDDRE
eukprot:7187341-Ditylum_brightwellii.AAC.1